MKISIITAVFNGEETIADAVLSLNSQGYKDIEHVIVDGASTDRTLKILRGFSSNKFNLISEKDDGIYNALNKGIKNSTGDVIGFLHADDIFSEDDVLSHIASAFMDPSVDAVYGDLLYVSRGNKNKIIRRWISSDFNKRLLNFGWMPPHPTLFVRRRFYEQIGGFNENYKISADYLSILNLFQIKNFNPIYLNRVITKMRIGGISNRSLKNILKKSTEDWRALRSVGFGVNDAMKALLYKNMSKIIQYLN